jgi:glucokinase
MQKISRNIYLGVDVGGTKTAVVLSSRPPASLGRIEFATLPEEGPERALGLIVDAARSLLAQHGFGEESIAAIGVSCGSPLDRVRGTIQAPPNLSTWVNVPICRFLAEAFHTTCRLENDANAGAVAEHRFGAGVGSEHMVFLTLGTGLGAGIIAAGSLYLGANGDAGEIGHVRLSPTGPVGYHKAGSIEGWASGGGIAQLAVRMLAQAERRGRGSVLHAQAASGAGLTARDVGLAAHAGDAVALSILRTSGARLGQALALLMDVLNPQRIVLGGLAWRMGENLLGPMRRMIEHEALPQTLQACEIVPAALGEQIGDVSALCVAMGLEGKGDGVLKPRVRIEN